MKIGHIDLGHEPIMLAPMEDVTDIGFRLLCKQMGAAMVYSEFVSADALIRMVNKSLDKLRLCDDERPVAIQIYGRDVDSMREAARIVVDQARPDVLDLNFGCPVKKVAGKGAGSGMLRNVPLLLEIVRAVVEAVPDTPVTVKTRLGWDENSLRLPDGRPFIVDLAERLQDEGIMALTIHGRTRAQMYQGEADWTLIGEVKGNPRMRIPIIGNGDIASAERVRECFDRYGVDGVMVGRATFGRPWIFRELQGGTLTTDEKRGHPQAAGHHLRAAHRRVPRHTACAPPPGSFARLQGHPQFPRDAHTHAPCRDGGRTLCHHRGGTGHDRHDDGVSAVWLPCHRVTLHCFSRQYTLYII